MHIFSIETHCFQKMSKWQLADMKDSVPLKERQKKQPEGKH